MIDVERVNWMIRMMGVIPMTTLSRRKMTLSERISQRLQEVAADAIDDKEILTWASDAQQLEGALRDLTECVHAQQALAGHTAYKGRGVDDLRAEAEKLPAALRYAESLLPSHD